MNIGREWVKALNNTIKADNKQYKDRRKWNRAWSSWKLVARKNQTSDAIAVVYQYTKKVIDGDVIIIQGSLVSDKNYNAVPPYYFPLLCVYWRNCIVPKTLLGNELLEDEGNVLGHKQLSIVECYIKRTLPDYFD